MSQVKTEKHHDMRPTKKIFFPLPGDKGERELRFTMGARKRIGETFGCSLQEALNKYDAGAIPGVLWALMHDEDGNPPDVTVKWLEENLADENKYEYLSLIMSANMQGRTDPKAIEELLRAGAEMSMSRTGLISSPSVPKSSASPVETSGGDSSNAKLQPASTGIEKSNDAPIKPSESSPVQ